MFLSGKDIIAQAQSGTGKTATFSISILQLIDESIKGVQAIIMSPTRELSEQIYTVIRGIAFYTNIRFALILGGQSRIEQINEIRDGAQCIICTPGRFNDFLHNSCVDVSNVKHIVIDEADELLTNAFIHQVKNIVEVVSNNAQKIANKSVLFCLLCFHKFMQSISIKNKPILRRIGLEITSFSPKNLKKVLVKWIKRRI